jgi:hypothetical protein
MTGLRKVLVGAAAVHLVLAALYAPHVPIEPYMPRSLDRIVALYGSMSGVRNHFDFFAPSVSTQARVEFRVGGPDGTTRVMRLATPNGEVNNRIALMLTYYSYPGVRESLLQGLGEYMLRLNPHATTVEVRIDALEIPTLREVAAGNTRPRWTELGRAQVRGKATPGN